MAYMDGNIAFAGGIQELSFDEIDAVFGSRGTWNELGAMVAGGMFGGAVTGAIAGAPGGPETAGLGAAAGAIGGGVGAVVTWFLIKSK